MSCSSLIFRRPIPDDWERVMAVMPAWWDGRDLRAMLPRIFFEHFRGTSLLVEHEDRLVALPRRLLLRRPPRRGLRALRRRRPRRGGAPASARDLYRRFFALARADGRTAVRAVTAPVNTGSIAFHTALGFSILPGDDEIDGVPVTTDHGPHGDHLVRFQLLLEPEAGA